MFEVEKKAFKAMVSDAVSLLKEAEAMENVPSETKRDFVIKSLATKANKAINIPIVPESIEQKLFEAMLEFVVDTAVELVNDITNKDWKQ